MTSQSLTEKDSPKWLVWLKHRFDLETINLSLLTYVVLLGAIQILIVVVFIFSFIPIQPTKIFFTIYPHIRDGIKLERDIFFYRLFIVSAIILQGIAVFIFKNRIKDEEFALPLFRFACAESLWVLFQFFAVFKVILFPGESWTRNILYLAIGVGAAGKFFWPEVERLSRYFYLQIIHGISDQTSILIRKIWDWVFPAMIILFLAPDMQKVLARVYVWDRFYHWDGFVMAPGWGYLSGMKLNMDIISQYGVVMPVVLSRLAQLLGGFDYEHVGLILVWATIFYFIMCYVFLRMWLKSAFVATIGILIAIKLQMFQIGALPLIWRYPSATMIRSFFDLIFLSCLLKHTETQKDKFLWRAAFWAGISLSLMIDTGIYQIITLYAYCFVGVVFPQFREKMFPAWKNLRSIIFYVLIPWTVALFILWLIQGKIIFSADFWKNSSEFTQLFLQGFGALPMYSGLHDRQFFAFFMGFIIPCVYIWTMIWILTAIRRGFLAVSNVFVVILCVYGLGLYHYFICRSATTSYYTVCVPFVLVLTWWIFYLTNSFKENSKRNTLLLLLFFSFGALFTNLLFVYYPNMLKIGHLDWDKEEKMYSDEFTFTKDVDFIDRLTTPEERVPLISSFEVKILMDAKRKPFFYYFPLLESRPMKLPDFGGAYLFTESRMRRILKQLDDNRPARIFIERKLFLRELPKIYYQHYTALNVFIQYLEQFYEVDTQGEYLLALKRKIKTE